MAGIVALAVLMLNSLSVNKANVYNQSARRIGKLGADSLCSSPGEIFRGQACEPCYCDDRKTAVCGPAGTCTLGDKVPKKADLISMFNKRPLKDLEKLLSTASKCVPGRLYRVACNRCICDATASLDCENLLCPSITDVKRLNVKTMSGKHCVAGDIKKRDCVECKCKKGKYACVSLKDCVPSVALELEQKKCRQGKKNHHSCPVRLDREATSQPLLKLDPALGSPVRLQKAFLDPKSSKKCTPGVIYSKDSCNKCTCSDNNILHCTSMSCISGKESVLLKRWRIPKRPARPKRPKTKRPEADKKKVTDKDGVIMKVEPEIHLHTYEHKPSPDGTYESGEETLPLKRPKGPKRPKRAKRRQVPKRQKTKRPKADKKEVTDKDGVLRKW